jgi:NTP pyrophosphatase (non-canonical NTP hydrolase)
MTRDDRKDEQANPDELPPPPDTGKLADQFMQEVRLEDDPRDMVTEAVTTMNVEGGLLRVPGKLTLEQAADIKRRFLEGGKAQHIVEQDTVELIYDGHDLAREIIRKHGVDRYPSHPSNYKKLLEEVGELGEAIMAALMSIQNPGRTDAVRKEYADVGISLYALGDKLGLNLIDEMRDVVKNETRSFARKNKREFEEFGKPIARCEARARKGTGEGVCDEPLIYHDQGCDNARNHL